MKTAATEAREAAGLSVEAVALRAGCCAAYLKRIERGRGTCSYALATRLARVVGCSANLYLYAFRRTDGGGRKQPSTRA